MAQVAAEKIIDALAYRLGKSLVEQTINELAVEELEARVAELEDEAAEPKDPERDSGT